MSILCPFQCIELLNQSFAYLFNPKYFVKNKNLNHNINSVN